MARDRDAEADLAICERDMQKLKSNGYTYRQIGDIYGLSPGATLKRIKRAKEGCS